MKNLLFKKAIPVLMLLLSTTTGKSQETGDLQHAVDSCVKLIRDARHDTIVVSAYIELCDLLYITNPDTVIPLSKKAAEIATRNLNSGKASKKEKKAYYKALAGSYNNIGFVYERNERYDEALSYYQKSLAMEEKWGNEEGAAMSRSNIGLFYFNRGNIQKATEMFYKNLDRQHLFLNKKPICYTLNNLGYLYDSQGDTVNALKYYRQCLELSKSIDFWNSYANCASNIGIIHLKNKQYNKALALFKESREICRKTGDLESEAIALNNIGGVYQKTGRLKEALQCFAEAIVMLEKTGSEQYIAHTLTLQGGTYLDKGEAQKALPYLQRSAVLSAKIGYPENIKRSAGLLHRAYKILGRPKEALEAYETFITMRDSLENAENKKIAAQKQLQYEYEKKDAEAKAIAKAEKEKNDAINLEEKAKQNLIIYSVCAGLLLVIVFAFFIYNRFKVTQKQKKLIEIKEKETQLQKHLVEEQNKEIFDSIDYAERLQRSLMAHEKILDKYLNEYFVYFNPKEAVSGDFYWASILRNGNFVMAVADSTGHGVPGAIMSMMNMNSLKETVKEGYNEPNEILDHTRKIVVDTLANDGSAEGGKDGMDVALLVLNKEKTQLDFALANNPLWLVRNNEVIEYKADKMPVGKHDKQDTPFTKHSIDLIKGDVIYVFTDGYADQFGGDKGKKFKYSEFKELLLSISGGPMDRQKELLHNRLTEWKGNMEQIDDVCVVGIRI